MDQHARPGTSSATGVGPIEMMREGMTVVDSAGEKVGKVEGLKMGDPGAATEAGNEYQDTGLLGDIAKAFGDEREPDVPEPARAKLLRSGYIKVDGGVLIETDRYGPADLIASVSGDTVRLRVPKDQLIKEE
jgi:hypothetical protein